MFYIKFFFRTFCSQSSSTFALSSAAIFHDQNTRTKLPESKTVLDRREAIPLDFVLSTPAKKNLNLNSFSISV
jgi:hypothetical protein